VTQAIVIDEKLTYEQCLAEVEKRITDLEQDTLDVASIIKAVREGRAYHARCVEILNRAKKEIEIRPTEVVDDREEIPSFEEEGKADVDPNDIPF
jgi:exodeoxyribonuclease VII small subunit